MKKNFESLISNKETLIDHKKTSKLAVVVRKRNKQQLKIVTDSRKASHLHINDITKILVKEKISNYYNRI